MTHYDKEREADELWRNAPEGAEYFNSYQMNFYKVDGQNALFFDEQAEKWCVSMAYSANELKLHEGTVKRPQSATKQPVTAQESPKTQSPYHRTIIGFGGSKCVVDVYRVLDAFKTDSPALDHAVKKILCPGTRHAKTREQDLKEAIKSIEAELLLMRQR